MRKNDKSIMICPSFWGGAGYPRKGRALAQKTMKKRRYQWAYRAIRALACPYFIWRYRFEAGQAPDIKGPFLLVANHVTELDFMLVGASFKKPLVFVVGDTLLRAPVVGWLLKNFMGVIPKDKGMVDASTAIGILRRLRGGQSVCLFPEGNTCFDGRTGPFPVATGGLARAVGVPLVTYRIRGAYLALPRWGRGIRAGRSRGQVAGVYQPEALKAMSNYEVDALIARDLAVDAYEDQGKEPVAYRGKRRAEGLENALYLCPACRKMGSIRTRDDRVKCHHCGMEAVFDLHGAFVGGLPFPNVRDWVDSQREALYRCVMASGKEPVLSDADQVLCERGPGRQLIPVARGQMGMSRAGLQVGEKRFALSDLLSLEIYRKNILIMATSDGKRYQVRPDKPFNALKYRDMFHILKEIRR